MCSFDISHLSPRIPVRGKSRWKNSQLLHTDSVLLLLLHNDFYHNCSSMNHQSGFYCGLACGTVCSSLTVLCLYFLNGRKHRIALQYHPTEFGDNGEEFEGAGSRLLKWIINYRENIANEAPVISTVEPNYLTKLLPSVAPHLPESWNSIFKDLDTAIVPGLTNWESNRKFFAYFKPHSSYAAVLGEMLCAGINVMGFDWIASPACTELEVIVLDWLADFLNLPKQFYNFADGPGGSVIQGSAGESAIVAFLAAIVKKQGISKNENTLYRENMVVFASDQTHAIVTKACMVLGIGHCRIIKTTKGYRHYALNPQSLELAIKDEISLGHIPLVVVATTGTTSSCAFDNLVDIAKVSKAYDCWLHVDAAYGGAYACIPELSHLFDGLTEVDSFVVNCHKKLLCPFDISAMYVSDRKPILSALSLQPEYLRNAASESGAVVDYEHWQLPLGRRFRSLKLWFVMRRYGKEGLKKHIRSSLEHSAYFSQLLLCPQTEEDAIFELVVPVSLSLVCFRLKDGNEETQRKLLTNIKATGDCFIIHTKLDDKIVLRLACGGIEQSKEDVHYAYQIILREGKKILSSK